MDKLFISRVRDALARREDSPSPAQMHGQVLAYDKGCTPIPFSAENLRLIEAQDPSRPRVRQSAFIDGGIGDIIVSAGLCVHLVRIHSCIWSGIRRVALQTQEALVLVVPHAEQDGSMTFFASLFPKGRFHLPTTPFTFATPADGGPRSGTQAQASALTGKISDVGNRVRTILEFMEAERLAEEFSREDLIVRDGPLCSPDRHEEAAIERALEIARSRGVALLGLLKTCAMYTAQGQDALIAVRGIARRAGVTGAWWYHPLVCYACEKGPEDHMERGVVRLHPYSRHVFALDLFTAGSALAMKDIVGLLAVQADDAAFRGYPYPLVQADRLARVPNRETETLRIQLLASCKRDGAHLLEALASSDAHQILDTIG